MAEANLKRRIEELERQQLARPIYSVQFDEDALTIYTSLHYLSGRVKPDHVDVEPTSIYSRGKMLRDALYGPIIPVHLDDYIKRYSRASGEFELAFSREPRAGDILHHQQLALTHSREIYSVHFGKVIEAWQRQLPHLPCPLKFEEGRLLRRMAPEKRDDEPKWEEDVTIQPQIRWLSIPEVIANSALDPDTGDVLTIPAIVFIGVVGAKHQCRPATDEELNNFEPESPSRTPVFFNYGQQKAREVLIEVFGA